MTLPAQSCWQVIVNSRDRWPGDTVQCWKSQCRRLCGWCIWLRSPSVARRCRSRGIGRLAFCGDSIQKRFRSLAIVYFDRNGRGKSCRPKVPLPYNFDGSHSWNFDARCQRSHQYHRDSVRLIIGSVGRSGQVVNSRIRRDDSVQVQWQTSQWGLLRPT